MIKNLRKEKEGDMENKKREHTVNLDNDLLEEVYSHLDDIKDTADRMTSGNFMHHRAAIKYSANVIKKVLGLICLKAQKGE